MTSEYYSKTFCGSVEIATQTAAEKEELQKKLEESERQLHEQKGRNSQNLNKSER